MTGTLTGDIPNLLQLRYNRKFYSLGCGGCMVHSGVLVSHVGVRFFSPLLPSYIGHNPAPVILCSLALAQPTAHEVGRLFQSSQLSNDPEFAFWSCPKFTWTKAVGDAAKTQIYSTAPANPPDF
jgi:hypothetical protein